MSRGTRLDDYSIAIVGYYKHIENNASETLGEGAVGCFVLGNVDFNGMY